MKPRYKMLKVVLLFVIVLVAGACSDEPSSPEHIDSVTQRVSYFSARWESGASPCAGGDYCLTKVYVTKRGEEPPEIYVEAEGELGTLSQTALADDGDFENYWAQASTVVSSRDPLFPGCVEFEGVPEMITAWGGDYGQAIIVKGCEDSDIVRFREMSRELVSKYFPKGICRGII